MVDGSSGRAARLAREQENVWTALGWSKDGGWRQEKGLRIAAGMFPFWYLQGFTPDGQRWLESLLEGMDAAAPAVRAEALLALGFMAWPQGDSARAVDLFEAAHRLFVAEGNGRRAALALVQQATMVMYLGDFPRAVPLAEAALVAARSCQDRRTQGWSHSVLGMISHLQGDLDQAEALYAKGLALFRELGDTFAIGNQLANLASVARDRGDYEQARRLHRESLALRRGLNDKPGFAECFEGLAFVAAGEGELERAARLFGAAEAIREAIGRQVELADRTAHARTVPAVRAALDEDAFTSAWAAGRAMTLEAAIAYALDAPAQPVR